MSERFLPHIAQEVIGQPLLILPEKLGIIAEVLGGRIGIDAAMLDLGPRAPTQDMSRFVGSRRDPDTQGYMPYALTEDGAAVITITGSLVNRGAWVGADSGLTSYEGIKHQIAKAAGDDRAKAILLDIESPGGQSVGAFEVADAVRQAAAVKPVIAVVNGMAASAAYAIASAASRIVSTPSGISGSIGVVLLHADYSRKLDRDGITPTLIFAGAHKVDGWPFNPLSKDAKARFQDGVDKTYDQFVKTVAAGRKGLSQKAIRATEALTFIGQDAVDAGLADEIGTFESVLSTISRGGSRRPRTATGATRMDEPIFTQAQIDAATAKARSDAEASARQASDKAAADAVAADRARTAAIMALDEAKGRETVASQLAAQGLSAEAAKAILAAVPKASGLAARAGGVPDLGHEGGGGAVDSKALWTGITDQMNAELPKTAFIPPHARK